jgi:hypothetical protein
VRIGYRNRGSLASLNFRRPTSSGNGIPPRRIIHGAMNRARQVVLLRVLGVFYIGLILGGFGLHFWTVKMVRHVEGRGWIVALVFPVGAEMYWAIKEWRVLGFANVYTLAIIGYGMLCLLMVWALTILEKK